MKNKKNETLNESKVLNVHELDNVSNNKSLNSTR